MKLGLNTDIDNATYHAQLSPEEHFYSSSQLKTMLDDPETFYKKYITKELGSDWIPAFDIGTYYHTAILEPHLLEKECAVYMGKVRRGKEWEAFKGLHAGKAIITKSEYEQAKNLIVATRNSQVAVDLLEGGVAEVSLFIEVYVKNGGVYILTKNKSVYKLEAGGWCIHLNAPTFLKDALKLRLKVRADMMNIERGFILDLKSTKGNAKSVQKIRYKTSDFVYELSAGMYVDLFNAYYIIEGEKPPFTTFWWVYASKDYSNCKSYWSGVGPDGEINDKTLRVGRAKWIKAALDISRYHNLDWEIPDEPACLETLPFEDEWLNVKKVEEAKPEKPGRRDTSKKVKQNDNKRAIDLL